MIKNYLSKRQKENWHKGNAHDVVCDKDNMYILFFIAWLESRILENLPIVACKIIAGHDVEIIPTSRETIAISPSIETSLRFSEHVNKCIRNVFGSLKLIYNRKLILD